MFNLIWQKLHPYTSQAKCLAYDAYLQGIYITYAGRRCTEREREQGKENGSIIVEFCCSSEAHAPSRETKQRAQLGNY